MRWKLGAVAGAVTLAAAGGGIAAVSLAGSTSPQQVRLVSPSGATASTTAVDTTTTTTAVDTTTTTTATTVPPTTVAPTTSTTTDLVTVPNIVGLSIAVNNDGIVSGAAVDTLNAAGLRVGPVEGHGQVGNGGAPASGCFARGAVVSSQGPPAGAEVIPGSAIGVNC